MYTTFISTNDLALHLHEANWVILDCRYAMVNPAQSEADYLTAHIPGAVYLRLEGDLAAPAVKGVTGRHPLPDAKNASRVFSRCGITSGVQVVAYDAAGGAMAAARAWWMLRWLGHTAVAVLDGGLQKWQQDGNPVSSGVETNTQRRFKPRIKPEMVMTSREVAARMGQDGFKLLDSRSADRFKGENETVDPVAGHIPGAQSVPYAENLNPDGTMRSAADLQRRFSAILGALPGTQAVFYCGSGVTACHNILAMEHAGLGLARLYAGSWSEWITNPDRPIIR